jgi:hypothetical protein
MGEGLIILSIDLYFVKQFDYNDIKQNENSLANKEV